MKFNKIVTIAISVVALMIIVFSCSGCSKIYASGTAQDNRR